MTISFHQSFPSRKTGRQCMSSGEVAERVHCAMLEPRGVSERRLHTGMDCTRKNGFFLKSSPI